MAEFDKMQIPAMEEFGSNPFCFLVSLATTEFAFLCGTSLPHFFYCTKKGGSVCDFIYKNKVE